MAADKKPVKEQDLAQRQGRLRGLSKVSLRGKLPKAERRHLTAAICYRDRIIVGPLMMSSACWLSCRAHASSSDSAFPANPIRINT